MTFKTRIAVAIAMLILAAAWTSETPAFAQTTPTLMTVKVLSLDAQQRLIKLRLPDGTERTAELDDNVAGFAGISVGDNVVVALRGEPGRPRVSQIAKGTAAPAPVRAPGVPPAAIAPVTDVSEAAYVGRLAELSRQADSLDRQWSQFKTTCKAEDSSAYEGARGWLLLWDKPQAWDSSSGFCRDLFNQIVSAGSTISTAMAAADSEARQSLGPEKRRELARTYSLDWSSWGVTPPKRVEP